MSKQEEMRKGPWTEQEDVQLVWFVRLFGERRWDLLAKVSGLNRTGKSCRLRWVNYLDPGLKRGRMTPEEEHLVLELHAKWGNRWSRIARRLPGRTDNEIKNYWRTHMRKKAQERKKSSSSSTSSTSFSCSSTSSSSSSSNFFSSAGNEPASALGTDGLKHDMDCATEGISSGWEMTSDQEGLMDQIWDEIAANSNSVSELGFGDAAASNVSADPSLPFTMWQDCYETLWRIDDDEFKMLLPELMSSKHQHSKEHYQRA